MSVLNVPAAYTFVFISNLACLLCSASRTGCKLLFVSVLCFKDEVVVSITSNYKSLSSLSKHRVAVDEHRKRSISVHVVLTKKSSPLERKKL